MTKNIAAINQRIMEKFVRQNVYYNVTELLCSILFYEPGRLDEAENFTGEEEILQWWAVSGTLAELLKEKGEVVLSGEYWGRQTAGQAIYMDKVIRDICNDEEILCGQLFSWEREV